MEEKFVPGPERKLTLVVVTPGAASAGSGCDDRNERERDDLAHLGSLLQFLAAGGSQAQAKSSPHRSTRRTTPSARRRSLSDHECRGLCLPRCGRSIRSRPAAELVKAQVRTEVAQYPPSADATGVWYVEYG